MRTDPGHATQQHDHKEWDGPDDELQTAGIGEIRQVASPRVGSTKPPGESEGRGDRRYYDGKHDRERADQDRVVGNPDDPLWGEDGWPASRQNDGAARGEGACPSHAPRRCTSGWQSAWLAAHAHLLMSFHGTPSNVAQE